MAVFFFDSSALVKRYAKEPGSAWVRGLTQPKAAHTLYIARITAIEITSAITRKLRGGLLSGHPSRSQPRPPPPPSEPPLCHPGFDPSPGR